MSRTRKRLSVGVVALMCVTAAVALLRKPADVTIALAGYETNTSGLVTAVLVISNAGPHSVALSTWTSVQSRRGEPEPIQWEQGTFLPRFGTRTWERPSPCHLSAEYVRTYYRSNMSLSEKLQFWIDRHLLRYDRTTNVHTLHFDVP